VLLQATSTGQVAAAVMHIEHKGESHSAHFGSAKSAEEMFLLGSISKPISVTALMTLYDQNKFQLDDPAKKYLPEFTGEGRETITIRQLLTHVSGLPDQLPENAKLRSSHAPLSEFVAHAIRTPLLFAPGSKYSYSSMAILLAAEIAQRISGKDFLKFTDETVFKPLEMKRSAIGLGRFQIEDFVPAQVEKAAPESGAGDPAAKNWDWNSPYWRKLGAPWGTVHSSAPDIARFLREFLHPAGKLFQAETAKLMIQNHNRAGLTPRGLGFGFGTQAGCYKGSSQAFGHTGSTGTLAWADPATDTICVVLTTLPGAAVTPHPRQLVSDKVAEIVSGN
jgi:CubicO group peptidase (beta-lactamase class C family)